MPIIQGDLIQMAKEGNFDVIMHGCNCFHMMGAGIAKLIRGNFPEAWKADLNTTKGDKIKLGSYSLANHYLPDGKSFVIVNLYTQYEPGPNFDILAFHDAMIKVYSSMSHHSLRFGIPKIGSGIGGGNWEQIGTMADTIFYGENLVVVELP